MLPQFVFAQQTQQQQQQQQQNDSLLTIYNNKSENDSVRLDAFFEYSKRFRKTNPDTILILADELLERTESLANGDDKKHFEALAHYLKGNAYTNLKDYEKGEFHFNKRLSIEQDRNSKLGLANAFMSFGWFNYRQREYTTSKKWYSKVLKLTDYPREKEKKAGAYKAIGLCFYYQEMFDSSLYYWNKEVQLYKENSDNKKLLVAYYSISYNYLLRNKYDSALVYFFKQAEINEELNDKKEMAKNYHYIGYANRHLGNYNEAITYLNKSININEVLNDSSSLALSYNILGLIHSHLGNYPRALEYHFKSLKLREEMDNLKQIAECLYNIGRIYYYQQLPDETINYANQALKIFEQTNNLMKISDAYLLLGGGYTIKKKYEIALEYYKKSLTTYKEINDKYRLPFAYNNIGEIYKIQGKNSEALNNYLIAKNINEEIKDKRGIASSYNLIGNLKNKIKRFNQGRNWCLKSLELATNIGALNEEKLACECLSEAYQALGNYQKAYEYQQQYYELKDSLFNEEKTKELTRLEMNYAFEQEQDSLAAVQRELDLKNQAQLQKAEATRNYSIGGFGAAAILAFLMYSRFNVSRKKNKIIQAEKDRSEELLLNILPEETALELKEKGVVQAQHHDEVTVLFADITNFTQLSERVPPQELVATIHTYFSAFDQIMEKHGIEKIKTIGDAYMAASGLQNKPEQAKRMVQAAQEMLEYVHENPLSDDINFRVGIHTGPVVSGVVGVKKFAYDIWGDTVNTAARMESASEPGKINISEATQQKIKDYFEHTSRGKVAIKGKGEMEMYYINN